MSIQCMGVGVKLGKRQVVRHVTFSSNQPELIGLIGPNGAGKSSLMRALVGLVDSSGQILFDDLPSYEMSALELARKVAYLPQERVVHWPLAVREIIMLGRMPYQSGFGRASQRDNEAVDRAITVMGLEMLASRPFNALSGGEKARVLIARLVAQEASVIIADEPINGLDPAHQIALMQIFKTLVANGKTVLVSLHDLSLASRWCERILILNDGVLLDDGSAREVMTAGRMEEVYGVEIRKVEAGGQSFVVPTGLIDTRTPPPVPLNGEEANGL